MVINPVVPLPLGQKLGKGPLLKTNLLHIQLVQTLGECLFFFILIKEFTVVHLGASKLKKNRPLFWEGVTKTYVASHGAP